MGRRAPTALLTALALTAIACGEPRPIQHDGKRPEQAASTDDRTATAKPGPGGEMIPGLALPTPIAGADDVATEASREQLLEDLDRALDEGRAADAASIADVLIVLDAEDAEAYERRARALEIQGDQGAAAADRKRCCELGRTSCCR
jgi:hypothetical protein